ERLSAFETAFELGRVAQAHAALDFEPAQDGFERRDGRHAHRGQSLGREIEEIRVARLAVSRALEELEHRPGSREAVRVLPEGGPVRHDVRLGEKLEIARELAIEDRMDAKPRLERRSEPALRPARPLGNAAHESKVAGEEMDDEARFAEPVRAKHE